MGEGLAHKIRELAWTTLKTERCRTTLQIPLKTIEHHKAMIGRAGELLEQSFEQGRGATVIPMRRSIVGNPSKGTMLRSRRAHASTKANARARARGVVPTIGKIKGEW